MADPLTTKDLERIEKNISEVKSIATENRDAILGKVGCPGVITTLAVMTEQLKSMETLTNNHLAHLAQQYEMMFQSRDDLQLERDKGQVTWQEILKDWAKPIITAISTALIIALLSRVGLI